MKFFTYITLIASIFICGCSYNRVYIHEGEFEVYAPAAYYGTGFSMDKKDNVIKINAQFHSEKEHTLQLNKPNDENYNISYKLKRASITGSLDFIFKSYLPMWGFGFGLDPYPFTRTYFGINSRYIELGFMGYFNFSLLKYNAEGRWNSFDGTLTFGYDEKHHDGGSYSCKDCDAFQSNLGVGAFLSIFPIKQIALTYTPFLYRPWWDDEVGGHDAVDTFVSIFTQYFGASILIAKHFQFSAGATLYSEKYATRNYWLFDSSIGIVF